jgi:hypothetical protein
MIPEGTPGRVLASGAVLQPMHAPIRACNMVAFVINPLFIKKIHIYL